MVLADILAWLETPQAFADLVALGKAVFVAIEGNGNALAAANAEVAAADAAADAAEAAKFPPGT
jgi:hypothetical protein